VTTDTAFTSFLQRAFAATGIQTQIELASVLGINRAGISMAKKKGTVPEKWALQLADIYGLNARWLLTGRGERTARGMQQEKVFPVPKVSARLCAGAGSFETSAAIKDTMFFPGEWIERKGNPKKMVLMDILGDSMEPELRDGDTVLIDQDQQTIVPGAIYAIAVQDTLLIKRIERHPDKLALVSTNPNYTPIFLQGDEVETMRILGRVLWSSREYR